MATKLSERQIKAQLKTLKGWKRKGIEISKLYTHENFTKAMGFVTSVALVAEKANHHPDIDIRWNKVTLSLSTHSAGGLTKNDFQLAREIDNI